VKTRHALKRRHAEADASKALKPRSKNNPEAQASSSGKSKWVVNKLDKAKDIEPVAGSSRKGKIDKTAMPSSSRGKLVKKSDAFPKTPVPSSSRGRLTRKSDVNIISPKEIPKTKATRSPREKLVANSDIEPESLEIMSDEEPEAQSSSTQKLSFDIDSFLSSTFTSKRYSSYSLTH
jgi:hypothetical protein